MLSEQERKEIDGESPVLVIEALKIVQKYRGWISDVAIGDIAEHLGMTRAEVDSVATFYNLVFRRPVGRHVLFLCDCVSCWVMGSEGVRRRVSERLGIGFGETSADGAVTLLPIACLGRCDRAPVAMLDGEPFDHLDARGVDDILNKVSGGNA